MPFTAPSSSIRAMPVAATLLLGGAAYAGKKRLDKQREKQKRRPAQRNMNAVQRLTELNARLDEVIDFARGDQTLGRGLASHAFHKMDRGDFEVLKAVARRDYGALKKIRPTLDPEIAGRSMNSLRGDVALALYRSKYPVVNAHEYPIAERVAEARALVDRFRK